MLVLPFRHPYQLAKTALSINEPSDGRLILGLGAGTFLKAFQAEEVDMRKRGKITDERLDLLTRLIAGESVTHEGEFHTFEDSRLISPVGRPQAPPVWIGASWSPNKRSMLTNVSPATSCRTSPASLSHG